MLALEDRTGNAVLRYVLKSGKLMFSSPMVVGYKGEIGRFILAGLLEHLPKANDILCTDVNNSDLDVIERLERADYVFLCVPLQTTEEWLTKFLPYLKEKWIVEQSSIKSFLYENAALNELKFISMHLLFRPSATPIADRQGLLFSDSMSSAEMGRLAKELEAVLRTPIVVIDDQEEPTHVLHDRLMARQQALVHRVILTLADELQDSRMRTYVGMKVCELAERIRSGDPLLYRMIQENKNLEAVLQGFEMKLSGHL
jgi:prephenate dehydrogenase